MFILIQRMTSRIGLSRTVFLSIICAIAAILLVRLFFHAWTQLFVAHCYDCDVFWAMGRGMVNGHTPYTDLFEAKPPGIFLLSALSLFLTDGRMLGGIAVFIVSMFVAIAPCYCIWKNLVKVDIFQRVLLSCIAFLFSLEISYYLSEGSFHYLPEQFGVGLGVLYVCIISLPQYARSAYFSWLPILAGLCMFGAIFMKEPFVLSFVAAGLILSPSISSVIRRTIIPLIVASIAELCALVMLGLLKPYLFVYLKEMLGWRMQSGSPLWQRPLKLDSYERMYDLFHRFSPVFSYALLFLLTLCIVMVFWRRSPKRSWTMHVPLVLVAVYLAVASVFTSGGYVYNQHHLFVLPAFFACITFLIYRLHETWDQLVTRIASMVAAIILCIASFTIPPEHYKKPFVFDEGEYHEKVFAREVDRLLDDCMVDQYLYIGLNGHKIFGRTFRSPMHRRALSFGATISTI